MTADLKCKVCGYSESVHGHLFAASTLLHPFEADAPGAPAWFQAARLEAVEKGMGDVASCSAYAEGKDAAHQEFAALLQAVQADAALAWRRVTELQERGTQLALEHRQQLALVRAERDYADAAAAGYEESGRYWERRLWALVRRLEDIGIAAQQQAPDLVALLAKVEELAHEFYDHDWDGEPYTEPDAEVAQP